MADEFIDEFRAWIVDATPTQVICGMPPGMAKIITSLKGHAEVVRFMVFESPEKYSETEKREILDGVIKQADRLLEVMKILANYCASNHPIDADGIK